MPAADPSLRHRVVLPDDPAGILEPHDILAAEEFAMPAPDGRGQAAPGSEGIHRGRPRWTWAVAVGLMVLWLRRRGR